jgi:hypothetical protein
MAQVRTAIGRYPFGFDKVAGSPVDAPRPCIGAVAVSKEFAIDA